MAHIGVAYDLTLGPAPPPILQGPVAEMLIMQAAKSGDWVCLQNCHLASSWMLRLEEKVQELARASEATAPHPDFRLWLTSMPSKARICTGPEQPSQAHVTTKRHTLS